MLFRSERPGAGDFARGYDETVLGQSAYFVWLNRSKESLTLDVKHAKSADIFARLLAKADVFIQNLAPGAAARLGLDAKTLLTKHPRLIVCDVSGYGDAGPYAKKKAYDLLIQSEAGVLSVTGTPDEQVKVGISIVDISAGMYAYSGILTALYQREKTGKGQYIDSAMLDVAMMLMGSHLTNYFYSGKEPSPKGNRMEHASSQGYMAKDAYMMVAASNKGQHERFFNAIGRPDLAKQSTYKERRANYAEQTKVVEDILKTKTAQEWEDYLQSKHVPATRTRKISEAVHDPQFKTRNLFHTHKAPPGYKGKDLTVPVMAFKFAHGGPEVTSPPPGFGQHNDEVLASLGYSGAEIAAMKSEGVV